MMETLLTILHWSAIVAGAWVTLAVVFTPIALGLVKRLEVKDPGERRAMLMRALQDGWRP